MDKFIQVQLTLDLARRTHPLDAEDGAGALAHPRREHPRRGQCRHCGREIRDLHGLDAVVRLRHLPLFDVPVFLEMRPTR